ncbi:MAG: peptide chain release factor N(5)-glutamine methyltransferase [Candidatus Sedimenticola sp. PURPLELP]
MTAPQSTIAQALAQAARRLSLRPDSEPGIEAAILLCHLLDKPRTHLMAWPDKLLTLQEQKRFEQLLTRRIAGEPVAYITGHREFWSLDLEVSPATLIPRPETELLVERALELIPQDTPWLIADLGTGSGAIALAVASERPHSRVIATDRSKEALEVATRNARNLHINNVEFRHGAWCNALPPGLLLNLILSNPPYVAEGDTHLGRGDLPWEPSAALASGSDGLMDIRIIASEAPKHLAPGGALLVEHGFEQGEAVRNILENIGFSKTETLFDLEHRERLSEGFLKH